MSQREEKADMPVSASQVLRRLADIEADGAQFYEGMLEGTDSDWIRELARSLVRAENRHRERFLAYANKAEEAEQASGQDSGEPLPQDVVRLLSAPVFVSRARVGKSAKYAGDKDMLKVAVHMEESLALLLSQLQQYVPKSQRPYIKRVVNEEWDHKAQLERVMKEHLHA
jgi:rubrerythrin